jgi:hypothetical protein
MYTGMIDKSFIKKPKYIVCFKSFKIRVLL